MIRPLGASGERREEMFIVIGSDTGFEELAAVIISATTAAAVIRIGKYSCALVDAAVVSVTPQLLFWFSVL